ncbi:hypothetical protein CL656_05330 [bacterium]|nr:hypothetical protein [bacterium]|tara:strand:- start:1337 stop:2101 length:765 start_codon:yes stop_codon:yes gene_type:complete
MEIIWKNCEPTEENYWENLRRCDKYNNLQHMLMVLYRYYKLEGNEDKSPKDLELELRKRNFNFGLIACEKDSDPDVKRNFDDGKIAFIKPKYVFGKNKINFSEIEEQHYAKYRVIVSCRPREFVIKETLDHSSSIEENLEKLEYGGDIINVIEGGDNEPLSKNDYMLNEKEKSLNEIILEGKKLVTFKEVNFEEVFANAQKEHPNSKPQLYAMGRNGEPIFALVNDGVIVCQIGFCIAITSTREKIYKFVPLPR